MYNDHKVKPLHIILPKTNAYVKSHDGQTNWMYCLIEDVDLLGNYNTLWNKVSADIKKEFDSEPAYNKNFLKTKIKSHGDKVTDFYDKEIPKLDSSHTCLAVFELGLKGARGSCIYYSFISTKTSYLSGNDHINI